MTRLCFADVETTGTDPDRHHLWEIGIVVRDIARDGDIDREYCWQITPDLSTADPGALRISRYYDRNQHSDEPVGTSYSPVHPAPEFRGFRETTVETAHSVANILSDAVLVAANVGFDAAFLDRFLRHNHQAPSWNYHLLEIESYAAGALGIEPPWRLDGLLDAFGIKVPEDQRLTARHTALGDALAVRDLYDACRDPEALAEARRPRGQQ